MTSYLKEKRILYMGTPEFACAPLRGLVEAGYNVVACATQPDKAVGRKQILTAPAVKQLAQQYQIPVFQWSSLRSEQTWLELRGLELDLIITCAYGLLLPPQVLALGEFGCLNIHPSLLPRFRGAAPVQATLLAGDEETGVCVILMEEGLDTGAIIGTCKEKVLATDDAVSLSAKLSQRSSQLLLELLPQWFNQEIKPQPQAQTGICYAAKLARADGALDFRRTAVELANQVRALYPWPAAHCFYRTKQYKIYQARARQEACQLPPGTVLQLDSSPNLCLACGQGILEILELQAESGKRLPASAVAHNFGSGSCFSSCRKELS